MAKYLTKSNLTALVSLLLLVAQTIGVLPTAVTPQPILSAPVAAPCPSDTLLDAGTP